MSYATWEAIAETPWWIYLIIVMLLSIGYLASKPRYIHLKQEYIAQSISMLLLLVIMTYFIPANLKNATLAVAGLLTGYTLGWLHFYFGKLKAIKGSKIIYYPGTWLPLIIIPCLIALKYWYFGHRYFIDAETLKTPLFQHYCATLGGLALGLFFGRLTILMRRIRSGPFIEAPVKTV